MCGILFSYNLNSNPEAHKVRCESALNKLYHRGPDDGNLICAHPVMIGHRRLSIIDIHHSTQPLEDSSKRYVLSFNGEIYNYKELRKELSGKWNFRTHGDTEVVMAGLVVSGKSFISKLAGMWGFALWDRHEETLLLCRDRLGKKPLYYSLGRNKSEFYVASELPAILTVAQVSPGEDEASVADYFRYGFFLPGTTVYKHVSEVMPGYMLEWSVGNGLKMEAYWQLKPVSFNGSKTQAQKRIKEVFNKAIEKRLVADVEVGAFLSGGIDSSLVVSGMSNKTSGSLKTFTIKIDQAGLDESEYAKKTSDTYSTDHYEETYSEFNHKEFFNLVINHVGQPFADASILPTARVSCLAAKYVKVALSGDGGDELFSGYHRYQARAILRWYTRLPNFLKGNIEKVIKLLPENTLHYSYRLIKNAHLFLETVNRWESGLPYIAPMMYSNAALSELIPEIYRYRHEDIILNKEYLGEEIQNMMYADALVYLPQDILLKVDRASMSHSLEVRAPFLDHELVELAFSLPVKWHRTQLRGKALLKSSLNNMLPESIWGKRKQGFGVPLKEWFSGDLGQELAELNNSITTPLNRKYVNKMLNLHRRGERDHGFRLWQQYCYLKWKSMRPN